MPSIPDDVGGCGLRAASEWESITCVDCRIACMQDVLFDFQRGKMPPAVILATAILFAVFALGIVYRLLSVLVL